MFSMILRKLYIWENLFLQLWLKVVSTNLLSSVSLEETNQNLRFLHEVSHQGKVASGCTTFGLFLASCASSPVRFQESLIVNQ